MVPWVEVLRSWGGRIIEIGHEKGVQVDTPDLKIRYLN